MPPLVLMRTEGIDVLEEWFRWAEEWSMLLRVHGPLARDAAVLEIGCGLGRVAFALRYLLSEHGRYEGFDIVRDKIDFLKAEFEPRHPNFRFTWADVQNTYYNPGGEVAGEQYRFPYDDESFDIVFAASVFTHMLPPIVARYIAESARVLKPGGRCVFSFFLLDNYEPGRAPPARLRTGGLQLRPSTGRLGLALRHRCSRESRGDDRLRPRVRAQPRRRRRPAPPARSDSRAVVGTLGRSGRSPGRRGARASSRPLISSRAAPRGCLRSL